MDNKPRKHENIDSFFFCNNTFNLNSVTNNKVEHLIIKFYFMT